MRPTLIIGLGNPLMGDDGAGAYVARRLSHDPRAAGIDVLLAGTDLLRHADRLHDRPTVILIDAAVDDRPAGTVTVADLPQAASREGQDRAPGGRAPSAHQIAALDAVRLLQLLEPALAETRFILVAVSVTGAEAMEGLSPDLAAALPAVVDRVLYVARSGDVAAPPA